MGFNIADLFERAVDAVPDRMALVCGERRLTYLEMDDEANRLANHLLAEGFGHGDHIGIYGQNTAEWLVAMVAIFKIRAVPININFRYVEDELAYLFDNADLVALVHDREYIDRIAAVSAKVPGLRHFVMVDDGSGTGAEQDPATIGAIAWEDAIAGASAERPDLPRTDDDHYVIYTGGTTGMPKGVVWRHEDVFYALGGGVDAYTNERVTHGHQLAEKAAATPAPMVSLNIPPLMHGAAQWGALRFLFEGNTVVFVPRFSAEAVWSIIEAEKVNTMMITGDAMARPLIETLQESPDRWDLSSLFVTSSSAVVFSPSLKDAMLELLPNIMVIDAIGSSESGMNGMVIQTKGQTANHGGGGPTVSAGRDAVVLDDDLVPLPAGTGVVGKLARGGNIPIGYYKDPVKTAATFVHAPDGTRYVVAGDFALHEADGTITLLGRGSVCINSGGEKIFPEEVESVLKGHPEVYDVLVVGVPDDRWGQAVCAVVQPRHGEAPPTLADLDAHSRTQLAAYKTPRHLVLVDEIQRSPSGKPDYPWATEVAKAAVATPADA
ncbi:acyl-CoA synthetase [Aquihabitans sp. G128]|uniref:acyl-CoA synthetase n=1 Tax=Aquihabitans sp. G128 TaxID=2849779 RepID=UPI001C21277D|nr:acyl-CoA synthetase [Aquihabitans sp. G128]QXC62920.1 acyl-CoA synthetase [Aquihabitans sp. G128]